MIIKAVEFDILTDLDKYYKNEEKCDFQFGEPCAICGKPIKNGSSFMQIRKICGGQYFTEDKSILPDDMGWFKVGKSCYHKFKKLVKDIQI